MRGTGIRLSKTLIAEIAGLYQVRKLKDGITFFELSLSLDLYEADHSPAATFRLMALNFLLLEIGFYRHK